jgi:hypothetical protein
MNTALRALLAPARVLALACGLLSILPPAALAFERAEVLSQIAAARPKPAAPPPPGVAMAPAAVNVDDQARRAAKESEAAFTLMSTCEGRFGALRRTLERQVGRAELIATAGGVIGVLGAVATCPQCAALAAGLAGLANPLQQTYRANADTPQDTMAMLARLSERIDKELEAYRKLPPAVPGAPDFEANLRARLDALFITAASCAFYSRAVDPAGGATTP